MPPTSPYTSDRTLTCGAAPAVPATPPLNVAVTLDAECRHILSVGLLSCSRLHEFQRAVLHHPDARGVVFVVRDAGL
jgi:hypothetical protein